MSSLRILTFNWHDPYLFTLAKTQHQFYVADWMVRGDGTRGWDLKKRPLPDNLNLLTSEKQVTDLLSKGTCDLVLCHTLQDLNLLAGYDVPTIFLTHNALHNDALNDQEQMSRIRKGVSDYLSAKRGTFAAISQMKLDSWQIEGMVVLPGIDIEDYTGYEGEDPSVLCVGNMFVERDHMLGYTLQRQVLEGFPHQILGSNPSLPQATKAQDWEALKQAYRNNRLFLNTTMEAFEDGYNLAMIEAMATGMPVVSVANATSPIKDGENGFVSDEVEILRGRVEELLSSRELALELGMQGRHTVTETFPMNVFVDRWNEIFETCLHNFDRHSHPARKPKEGGAVKLRFERNDLYLYTWNDVSEFLSVDELQQICIPKVKLDRLGNSFLCELTLYNQEQNNQMVWQGLEVHRSLDQSLDVIWPDYLSELSGEIRDQVDMILKQSVKEVTDRGLEEGTVNISLQEVEGFEANPGEGQATPGDTPSAVLLHHAKRYLFARQFCEGKRVVDLGCGSGYGSRILAGTAENVIGLDSSDQAIAYARRAFEHKSVQHLRVDAWQSGLEDGSVDVVVCFDLLDQVAGQDALIGEVKRLLDSNGRFIVSVSNKTGSGQAVTDIGALKALLKGYFDEVDVFGQMPPQPGDDYFRMFDFKHEGDKNDEVILAVCTRPLNSAKPAVQTARPAAKVTPRTPELKVHAGQGGGPAKKILFASTSNPISAGTNYVDAFRRDHEVFTCGPMLDAETLAEWREAEAQHALKPSGAGEPEKLDLIKRLARPSDIPMPKGQVDIGQVLSVLPAGWEPDLFVWFDSGPGFLPMGLEKLNCPKTCLIGDTHTGQMEWRQDYALQFEDVFLMYNRPNIPDFEAAGCEKVHWLPGACDPRSHGMIQAQKAYDIGFVGQTHRQWHPDRVRLLERLLKAGHDVHIESKILEEMSLFYSRSRVVFNRSLNGYLNRRVFEALCSGSMLLTDRLPEEVGLEMLFTDREHLVLYDEDNLEELAEYYLRNEEEREVIAQQGRQAVLAEHTFGNRTVQVLETIFGIEEEQPVSGAGTTKLVGAVGAAKPRVSIVIPLFNQVDHTTACLEALRKTVNGTPHQLILVDNGSTDGTRAVLDSLEAGVDVVRNDQNLGFARGNNVGAARAEGEYLLFLNNDTIPHEGWLDALLSEADSDSEIGAVGPKLVYPDTGRVQHASLELVNGVPDHVDRHADPDDPNVNRARDLDMVTGACLMIRRTLFEELEGFDDGYVNGVEDVDLCLKARDAGDRVRYCPSSVLDHFEGSSDGRFDHVRPNLERFVGRWNGRFDGEGRFVPQLKTAPATALRGCWEGTQFVYHSLSLVNMALTSELIRSGACELQVIPYEPATFGTEVDPERYGPIAKQIGAQLSGPAQFHVRHQWPPNFEPPPSGHWVMIQPWEYGSIPEDWVKPMDESVDEIWAYTNYVKRCYVESGIDADRVHVIPMGVRTDLFHPDVAPYDLNTKKGHKFLFVGGAIIRKGIDVLLKVYREMFSRKDDVCLVIKGMGEETFYKGQTASEEIRKMQADPEAPEILYLTDDLTEKEMAGLYKACDCLVHPYRGEGFGLPVAEAMACGLPVVVTSGGACDDFCDEDRAYMVPSSRRPVAFGTKTVGQAWLLEPDAGALGSLMKRVLDNPKEAELKGQKGAEYVKSNLTWEISAGRVMNRLRALQSTPIRRLSGTVSEKPSVSESRESSIPGGAEPGEHEPVAERNSGRGDVDVIFVTTPESSSAGDSNAALDRFSGTRFKKLDLNVGPDGPATGLNQVLEFTTAEFVALVRDDAIVTKDWLTTLIGYLKANQDMAMVGPRMPHGPDEQRIKGRYRSTRKELQKFAGSLRQREAGHIEEVQYLNGACVLIRAEVLRGIGGFDSQFRSWAFLNDFARRCRQQGSTVNCAHDVFVHCTEVAEPEGELAEKKAVAFLESGDGFRSAGRAEDSRVQYELALEAKPDYLEAVLVLSSSLLEDDRGAEAADLFRKMEEIHPDSSRIKNYLGRCLYQAGEVANSRPYFEKAIEMDPAFAEAYSNLGVLLWDSGELDSALERLNKAAQLSPDHPDVIYNIAMIYAQLGQAKQAKEVLKHYLDSRPEDLDARVYLSILLLENGEEEEGLTHLEQVLEKEPENEEAMKVVAQLQEAVDASEDDEGSTQEDGPTQAEAGG